MKTINATVNTVNNEHIVTHEFWRGQGVYQKKDLAYYRCRTLTEAEALAFLLQNPKHAAEREVDQMVGVEVGVEESKVSDRSANVKTIKAFYMSFFSNVSESVGGLLMADLQRRNLLSLEIMEAYLNAPVAEPTEEKT